jgi:hypothetical protein
VFLGSETELFSPHVLDFFGIFLPARFELLTEASLLASG